MAESYAQSPLFATEKRCKDCGEVKPLSQFPVHSGGRYRGDCKPCHAANVAAYVERNKEKVAVRRHAYYMANRERLIAKQVSYNEQHRERENERNRQWRIANPYKLIRKNRAYYRAHRSELLEQKKDYVRRNVASVREGRRLQYARRRGAESVNKINAQEWQATIEYFGGRCAYCGCIPDKITQDHVVPIAKGGPHVIENVVPACSFCNTSKKDKSVLMFLIALTVHAQIEAAATFAQQIAAKME